MSEPAESRTVAPYGTDPGSRYRQALLAGEVPIAVYGLGKVGLPLAAVYAEKTGNVVGVDVDSAVVDDVESGRAPFDHEPGLSPLLSEVTAADALRATTDGPAAAAEARVHVLIVPVGVREPAGRDQRDASEDAQTPDGRPREADLSALEAAVEDVAAGLSPGDLILVECTVPPGTCRTVVAEELAAESNVERSAFGVTFSPERVSSGTALTDVRGAYPRVVGGVDDESTRAGAETYRALVDNDVLTVSDARTAEAVKLFEGVYRDVNIALANELGRAADDLGIDSREAISAANTQPYCDILDPGAGVGGHCIPYYPHFLLGDLGEYASVIPAARRVNDAMPSFVVETVADELETTRGGIEDATVGVLGLAYRPGIPELSASPAFPIIAGLQDRGAAVYAVDPVVDQSAAVGPPLVSVSELRRQEPDAVVLVTAHEEFLELDWDEFGDTVVIDGRDALDDPPQRTYTVGRGGG